MKLQRYWVLIALVSLLSTTQANAQVDIYTRPFHNGHAMESITVNVWRRRAIR